MEIKLKSLILRRLYRLNFFFHLLILFLLIVSFMLISDKDSYTTQNSENLFNSFEMRTQCSDKKTNIVFIKTHKCASSAIQNIFLRFGYNHSLKFVLPFEGNYLNHPKLFSHKTVPTGKYNIITHHTRLNYPEMYLIMPLNTVYVTILRNPVTMFESMYNYYNLDKFYKFKFKSFGEKNLTRLPKMSRRYVNRIGSNQMFFDLGFDLSNSLTRNFTAYIKYLDSIFDLVMIEEFMDESLILLKKLLCWSTDDVITFKVNARRKRQPINELAIKRIQKLNEADMQLYEHFLDKFKQRIAIIDNETLNKEIQELRSRRKYWFDECVDKEKMKQKFKKFKSNHTKVILFERKKDDLICKFLTSIELNLTKLVKDNQIKLYPNSVFKFNMTNSPH